MNIFYLDFETTGLNPYHDEIIEIAIKPYGKKEIYTKLTKPLIKKKLNYKVVEITKITDQLLAEEGINIYTAFNELLSNLIYPIVWSLIGGTEKETEKKFRDNTFAQRVENKPQEKDHQKLIHLDTYFPAIKYWWFPEKVAKEQGPLCYVKNSCYSNEKMQNWY